MAQASTRESQTLFCQLNQIGNEQLQNNLSDGKRGKFKLAILARENITFNTLFELKPLILKVPFQQKYEAPIEDAEQHTESERQIRNSQLKQQRQLKN